MTTTTTSRDRPISPGANVVRPESSRRLLPDLLGSEWTKLRTVRSTYWTLFATAVGMVGLGIAASFVAFFVGQSILASKGIEAHIGDPGVVRSVIGAGLYLTVLGLLALGLGTLIRRTAGGIAAVIGLVLILPGLVNALPSSWQNAISKYLPSLAGQALIGSTASHRRTNCRRGPVSASSAPMPLPPSLPRRSC